MQGKWLKGFVRLQRSITTNMNMCVCVCVHCVCCIITACAIIHMNIHINKNREERKTIKQFYQQNLDVYKILHTYQEQFYWQNFAATEALTGAAAALGSPANCIGLHFFFEAVVYVNTINNVLLHSIAYIRVNFCNCCCRYLNGM